MKFRIGILSAAILFAGHAALSAATIDVGTWVISTAQPGLHSIPIYITGNETFAGVELRAQVADGGPNAPGGSIAGPLLVSDSSNDHALLAAGALFANNNSGVWDTNADMNYSLGRQVLSIGTLTDIGEISLSGTPQLLGVLLIDTTGIAAGDYELRLSDTLDGSTEFLTTDDSGALPINITNGWIRITAAAVPEPSSMLLAAAALVALVVVRRRA